MGSPVVWMVVFTIVFVAFIPILGGQYAVIRTDLLQLAVLATV
jgi:hypothetical protein